METSRFLAVVQTAYPEFGIDEQSVMLWHQFLSEMDFKLAQERLMKHIRTCKFSPKISDIVYEEVTFTSVQDAERIENEQDMLMLQEYHSQDVKPMPEHIKKKLNALSGKVVVDDD